MLRLFAAIGACCLFAGCATVNPMAFDKNATSVDTNAKSVVLVAIDVSRSDDSRYVPRPFVVKLELPNAQSKEERQNFKMAKDVDSFEHDGHTIFLARMALAPGKYKFGEIMGMASAFPFNGMFVVPVNSEVTIAPHSVAYIGHIAAKLRPREGTEFRAGPVLPLIDQSATGFSGGTWDIVIDDQHDADVALFRTNFPVLNGVQVENNPLPPFDRAAYQKLWDGEQQPETKDDKKVSEATPAKDKGAQ